MRAREHEVPHGRADPVARDGERRDGPGEVHERHAPARETELPERHRGQDRGEASGAEDEPEIARGGLEIVLDDVGDQHLHRAHEQQVGDGRADERDPEPAAIPHEAPALAEIAEHAARAAAATRAAAGGRISSSATADAPKLTASSANTAAAPNAPTRTPPSAGPTMRRAIGRISWSSALACASWCSGHQVGDDRVERRREERLARAVDGDEDRDVPDLEEPGGAERRERGGGEQPRAVRRQHQAPSVEAIAQGAADEQEDDRRHGHRDADHAHRGRGVAQLVDLPGQRHDEGAVAEERDAHPGPQQPEVAMAQRRQQALARCAAGAVEAFVTMVHLRSGAAARPRSPRSRRP